MKCGTEFCTSDATAGHCNVPGDAIFIFVFYRLAVIYTSTGDIGKDARCLSTVSKGRRISPIKLSIILLILFELISVVK